jgi:hypothetical protein
MVYTFRRNESPNIASVVPLLKLPPFVMLPTHTVYLTPSAPTFVFMSVRSSG